jgi:acetyl-CoA synthetase
MSTVTWFPSKELIESTNLFSLMQETGISTFEAIHAWSVNCPAEFWKKTIQRLGIQFAAPYRNICDLSAGPSRARWLPGARMNIVNSCFKKDRQRPAVVTGRPDGTLSTTSIPELDSLSNRVANSLTSMGFKKGDAIAVYLAMTVDAVAIYLGILKMGGVVVSISESFAPEEVAKRLRLGNAKAVFTQCVIRRAGKDLPLYAKLIEANAPRTIVLPGDGASEPELRSGDLAWNAFLNEDVTPFSVECDARDPINILFSSGTTGDPKAIPWDHTTPIKAASDGHYHHNIQSGDLVCWPTSLGWMMGPWLIFSTMLNDGIIALYEGSPLEHGFCRFVQDAKVSMLGVIPSMVKAWRKAGCAENLDWSHIRAFSSTGEASSVVDYSWLMQLNQPADVVKPVIEYCGGTELGGGYLANNLLQAQNPAEFNGKAMGIDFVVLADDEQPCKPGDIGEVFLKAPALGMSTRLLNGDNDAVYYSACPIREGMTLRRHGDRMRVLPGHCYQSDGRADNAMNLGGIKVGSAEIERCLQSVAGVVDLAAVGIPPAGGGPDRLVLYAVFDKPESQTSARASFQRQIRQHLNPLFHIHDVVAVDSLPRTASNKLLHRELRRRYQEIESGA